MITPEMVVAHARSYLGVPWHHQGRNRFGMDCLGLVVAVAKDLGLQHIVAADRTDYPLGEHPTLKPTLESVFQPVPVALAGPGDVVLVYFEHRAMHLGILSDKGIIHSTMRTRKIVEQPLHSMWKSRILGAYRYE